MSFARHLAGYKGDKRYVQPQRRGSTGDDWNLQDAHCLPVGGISPGVD